MNIHMLRALLSILPDNPWPPIIPKERDLSNSLVNVLLDAARKDYRQQKYAEIGAAMKSSGSAPSFDQTDSADPEVTHEEITEHLEQIELDDTKTKPSIS